MFRFDEALKVYLHRDPVDFRMGINGLSILVDGVPRAESTALLMLLAERHPESGLAPQPNSPVRSQWFETMIYLANTLLPAMRSWFYAEVDSKPSNAAAVKEFARGQIEGAMEHLNSFLRDGRQYLIGNQLSIADFLALMLMRWTRNMPRPATSWPNLMRYIQRLRGRPTFFELNVRERLTEWLNETP